MVIKFKWYETAVLKILEVLLWLPNKLYEKLDASLDDWD
jgi:hypothetical protein